MSVGSPHADSGSIAYCGQDMWLENGTLEDSIIDSPTRWQDCGHDPSLPTRRRWHSPQEQDGGVARHVSENHHWRAISRRRSFLRETPVEPTKGMIRPKTWPRTSKIQTRRVLRNEGKDRPLCALCVWEPVPSAHGGLDASLAAAAAARRVMAEELAGCTVRMVAHRGAALADSNLRADMTSGRIRAVTKDRTEKDDGEVDDDEGMAVGGGWENAMESLAQLAKK
ncbi:hypothetical protein MY4824_006693 [Beauveria thailandica]